MANNFVRTAEARAAAEALLSLISGLEVTRLSPSITEILGVRKGDREIRKQLTGCLVTAEQARMMGPRLVRRRRPAAPASS